MVKLDAAKPLPARIKILNWGINPSTEGPVILDATTVAVFQANQVKLGRQQVALDFEHNTVPGTEEYKRTNEPRPVAAFGAPLLIPNDGLYLETLCWTPDGDKSARNFLDLSAAPFLDEDGRVLALHSAALTKTGAVYNLPTFLEQAEIKTMSAALANQTHTMELKPENVITVSEFAPIVGLAANASKADVLGKLIILSALSALVIVKDGKAEKIFGAEIKDGKLVSLAALDGLDGRLKKIEEANTRNIATLSATVEGKVVTLNAEDLVKLHTQVQTLSASLKSRDDRADEAERARLLSDASREGKVIPLSADTIKTLPTTALKELIGGLPKNIVPLHKRGIAPVEGGGGDPTPDGFSRLVTLHVGKGKKPAEALNLAIKENPDGYKAWRECDDKTRPALALA